MNAGIGVDAGDARLHVEVTGVGAPVVLLHGFTGSAGAMEPLATRLGSDFRVIVPDLVGHGRSSTPPEPSAYSVDAMVRQVLSVADVLAPATFHLVGYSMGGRVALTLACDAGHRLRSLTLIGATAGIADAEARADRRAREEERARLIEADLPGFVDEWMANPLFAGQARLGPEFLARARAQRLEHDAAGLAASLRAAGTGSMRPVHGRLGQCTMPTLLLVGEDDEKFVAVARDLSRLLPRSSTCLIPGAGHSAHLEQPDAVAARVRELVTEIEDA